MYLYHILINWSQKFWVIYVKYRFIYEQCGIHSTSFLNFSWDPKNIQVSFFKPEFLNPQSKSHKEFKPQVIYNPITAMGFLAMFTLDNTLPAGRIAVTGVVDHLGPIILYMEKLTTQHRLIGRFQPERVKSKQENTFSKVVFIQRYTWQNFGSRLLRLMHRMQ